jgi:pectin methylesterase-like acyl-CoA thioesterase
MLTMKRALVTIIVVGVAGATVVLGRGGRIVRVPGNHSTIQAAIDAASPGATIMVAAGRYVESLDFRGKAVGGEGDQDERSCHREEDHGRAIVR